MQKINYVEHTVVKGMKVKGVLNKKKDVGSK